MNDTKTQAAVPALSRSIGSHLVCEHSWHGYPCESKRFKYWVPQKVRWSFALKRKNRRAWMKDCHCSKCGHPLPPANKKFRGEESAANAVL